tara:strand:- start:414 stop:1040 length:627 start_codon:yes stop_codon:yes gene_type:complete
MTTVKYKNANIHTLFPTPVYETYLDREITKIEENYINKVSTNLQENTGNITSASKTVLEGKPLKKLEKFFIEHVNHYFDEIIHSCSDIKPYITLSWLNYTKENEYHHAHEHENSMVSGVFYVSADENDSIRFYKSGYQQIKPEVKEYNLWNSTSWYIPARTGKLILFPSWLSHSVDHKKGNNVRISLAFNVFIKGTVGTIRNITKLEL